ncbi:hypothetical protein BGZ46_004749, partial [Entomortierella lignicola]
MDSTQLATQTVYDPSNQNQPQDNSSHSNSVSPTIPSHQLPLNITAAIASTQDHTAKSDQLDSITTVPTTSPISWPTRYFGEIPTGIDQQPSPEQLIQQQMLNQSRLMQ